MNPTMLAPESDPAVDVRWIQLPVADPEGVARLNLQGKRRVAVVQTVGYRSTQIQLDAWVEVLNRFDRVIVTDLDPAGEDPLPGTSAARLVEPLEPPSLYVPSVHLLDRVVAREVEPGDVIVLVGPLATDARIAAIERERTRGNRSRRKVCVCMGGDSAEREVSLLSGRSVAAALRGEGFEVEELDITDHLLGGGGLGSWTGADRPDVVLLAVHGTHAEDGAIQGLCELMHLPYTGSGIQSSALAVDKHRTKQLLHAAGVRVPAGLQLSREDPFPERLRFPVVVKPNDNGSTVGLTFVDSIDELERALARAWQYGTSVVVEERIVGVEVSVPVVGNQALPPVEIRPRSGSYDFAAKYTPGETEEICPARLPDSVLRACEEVALRTHQTLGCQGATRTDMIVNDLGEPVVLEINTLPGMTGTSLLPRSAAVAGWSFGQLCRWMVEDALTRDGQKA